MALRELLQHHRDQGWVGVSLLAFNVCDGYLAVVTQDTEKLQDADETASLAALPFDSNYG
jgi:hypothetical protein